MKVAKSKLRRQPNGGHLKDIMLMATIYHWILINFQVKNNIKYLINVEIIINIFFVLGLCHELSKSRVISMSCHNYKIAKNHTFYQQKC